MKQVTIYDTTLRDGTQGTGISFSVLDKIRVAEKLDAFGVDYIEGGWPGSNPRDVAFFEEAARRTWTNAKIVAFGSTRWGGVDVANDAQLNTLLGACTPVVTIVGKTWLLHVTEVLGVTAHENLAMISESVAFLKSHGREVFYDAEHFFDSYKDDPEYSLRTVLAARDAGADLVVLCDTNGGTLPADVSRISREVMALLGASIGIHTHNDCGLGVANALAAISEGACQVQGTFNGYGERVGNCNLTTIIPTLQAKLNIPVVPDLSRLRVVSRFVDELANVPTDLRAPYVGDAAFAHKGGLHVHAVQKLARSYEHMEPSLVGNAQNILVSDMSGQSNILSKSAELGLELTKGSSEVAAILRQVKQSEAAGYEFEAADASLLLLMQRTLGKASPLFTLQEYHCSFRRSAVHGFTTCEATVKIDVGGETSYTVEVGDGPVNALDAALRKGLRPFYPDIERFRLIDYKVRIIDGARGTAAKTRVLIVSSNGLASWCTVGVSDNIIEASWLALVDSFEFALGQLRRN